MSGQPKKKPTKKEEEEAVHGFVRPASRPRRNTPRPPAPPRPPGNPAGDASPRWTESLGGVGRVGGGQRQPSQPRSLAVSRTGWGTSSRPASHREVGFFGNNASMDEVVDMGKRLKMTKQQVEQLLRHEHKGNLTSLATAIGQRAFKSKTAEQARKQARRAAAGTQPKREAVEHARQDAPQAKGREARRMKNEEVDAARRRGAASDNQRANHGRGRPGAASGVIQQQIERARPPEDSAEPVQPRARAAGDAAVAVPDHRTVDAPTADVRRPAARPIVTLPVAPRIQKGVPVEPPAGAPSRTNQPASPAKVVRQRSGPALRGGVPGRAAPESKPGARLERDLAEGQASMLESRARGRRARGESTEAESTDDDRPLIPVVRRGKRKREQKQPYKEPEHLSAVSMPGHITPEAKRLSRMEPSERRAAAAAAKRAQDLRALGNVANDPGINPIVAPVPMPSLDAGSAPASEGGSAPGSVAGSVGRRSPASLMSDMLINADANNAIPALPGGGQGEEKQRYPADAPAARAPKDDPLKGLIGGADDPEAVPRAPPQDPLDLSTQPAGAQYRHIRNRAHHRSRVVGDGDGQREVMEVYDGQGWHNIDAITANQLRTAHQWFNVSRQDAWRPKKTRAGYGDEDKMVQDLFGYKDYEDMRDAHMMTSDGDRADAQRHADTMELAHKEISKSEWLTDEHRQFLADMHLSRFGHPGRGGPDHPVDLSDGGFDYEDVDDQGDYVSGYSDADQGSWHSSSRSASPIRGGRGRGHRGRGVGRGRGRRGRGVGRRRVLGVRPNTARIHVSHGGRAANRLARLESSRNAVRSIPPVQMSRWTHGKSFRGASGRNPTPVLSVQHLGPKKYVFRARRGVTRGIREQIRHYLSRVQRYVWINGRKHSKKQAYTAVMDLLEGNTSVEVQVA